MFEGPVDHVGHRLEASVRMPRGAFGLSRGILDLAHLVEMDEWIELVEGHAGERSPNRKSLAFQSILGGRNRPDRSLVLAPVGDHHWERQDIRNSYSRHWHL